MNGVNIMQIKKGSYGYINYNKKISFIKAIGGLSIILIIFVVGLLITKTRLNWFTFVAVLFALPVGKMIVALIMTWTHQSMPVEEYKKINEITKDVCVVYDLVITSYENVMQLDSIAMKGNTLCAYTKDKKLVEEVSSKYIKNILANNGCNCLVKIYKDLNSYLSRIEEMKNNLEIDEKSEVTKERENKKEMKAVETLLDISI